MDIGAARNTFNLRTAKSAFDTIRHGCYAEVMGAILPQNYNRERSMKMMLAIAFTFIATSAMADIPQATIDQLTLSGAEAAALAQTLPGQYKVQGEGNQFVSTSQKTWMPKGAKTRIVCTKVTQQGRLKSEECLVQKSGNGIPLVVGPAAGDGDDDLPRPE